MRHYLFACVMLTGVLGCSRLPHPVSPAGADSSPASPAAADQLDDVTPKPAADGKPPAPARSILDDLKPAQIPAKYRHKSDPAEFVAVLEVPGAKPGRNSVHAVAFSPDGRWLAAAGMLRVCLWDISDKLKVHTLPVDAVSGAAAFSSTGILAVAWQGTGYGVRLWDVKGAEPRELPGVSLPAQRMNKVNTVALSPNGKLLAAGGQNSGKTPTVLKLWEIGGPEPKEIPLPHSENATPYGVAFSPDGKTLAATGAGKFLTVWELTDAGPKEHVLRKVNPYQTQSYALAFSPDGKTLAGTDLERVVFWDVGRKPIAESKRIELRIGTPLSFAFAPDGKRLAGASGSSMAVLDSSGKQLWQWQRPGVYFSQVTFAPDGRHLATIHDLRAAVGILRFAP